jgi:hypothetical protein
MIEGITQAKTANTPAIVTAEGTILAANPNRKGFIIQNVGTGVVFIRLGGTASTSVFHIVLKGGTGDSDGNGGSYSQMEGTVFQGLISIAGTTPKVVVTELTR